MTFWTSNYCFWLKYESSIHNLAFSGAFDCSIMSLSIWLWKNTFSSFFLMHLKFIHLKCSVCSFLFWKTNQNCLWLLLHCSDICPIKCCTEWQCPSLIISHSEKKFSQIFFAIARKYVLFISLFWLFFLALMSLYHNYDFFFFLQHSFARKKFKLWGKSRNYPFLIPWQK